MLIAAFFLAEHPSKAGIVPLLLASVSLLMASISYLNERDSNRPR
jgi:hypothetical protein